MAGQRALPDFSDNLHAGALLHGYPTVPGQDEYPALRGNSVRHPVATSRPEPHRHDPRRIPRPGRGQRALPTWTLVLCPLTSTRVGVPC